MKTTISITPSARYVDNYPNRRSAKARALIAATSTEAAFSAMKREWGRTRR